MNYEDAIRKGLDIGAIKHLLIVNIVAIVITISLTISMRQLIDSVANNSSSLNAHASQYTNVLNFYGQTYIHTLIQIARNKDLISNDRYSVLNFSTTNQTEVAFVTNTSVNDFSKFSEVIYNGYWERLNNGYKRMIIKDSTSQDFFNLLFDNKINLDVMLQKDDPGYQQSMNEYNALSLFTNSIIYQLIHNTKKSDILNGTSNIEMNIFLKNTLTRLLVFLSTKPQEMANLVLDLLDWLKTSIVVIFVVNICLMVASVAFSVIFLVNTVRTFRKVCICLEDMKAEDLEFRSDQLAYVATLMEKSRLHPQHIRNLSSTGEDYKKKRKLKALKARSPTKLKDGTPNPTKGKNVQRKTGVVTGKGFHFFSILTSVIVLGLFYIGQFIFSGIIVNNLISKLGKINQLYDTETSYLKLTGLLMQYRGAILQTAILGPSQEVNNLFVKRYFEEENSGKSTIDLLINKISNTEFYSSNPYDRQVQTKVQSILTGNICEQLDVVTSKFLCSKLDVQIPQKGMTQVYYHIQNSLSQWYGRIGGTTSFQPLLNSVDYMSFELANTLLYQTAMRYLVNIYYDYIEYGLTVELGDIKTLITISIVFLVIFSVLFNLISILDIFRAKDELTHIFKTCSIDGVIENQRIRVVFLKLFALDNQYFS